MAGCTSWQDQYTFFTPTTWEVCYDIPVASAQGVWYRYPGQPAQFVAGGYYWSCPSNTYDVFKVCLSLEEQSTEYPNGVATIVNRSLPQVCVQVNGHPQGAQPTHPDGLEITSGLYQGYQIYDFILYTDQHKYDSFDWYAANGFVNALGEDADPTRKGAVPEGSLAYPANFTITSVERLSTVNGVPLTTYTFTVYDKLGNVLFTKTDAECPTASIQNANCQFQGNWVNTLIFAQLLAMKLSLRHYTNSSNQKCVDVIVTYLNANLINPINDPGGQNFSPLDQPYLTLCSPAECDYPRVYNGERFHQGNQQCPPGSCEVACGGTTCCYDGNGNLVSSFTSAQDNNASQYNSNISQSTIATNTTNYVNTNTNNPLSFGTNQVINSSFLEGTV